MAIEVGQEAPDFELSNQHGEEVSLSGFRGKKKVALVFYPLAFSGICTGELCELRDQFSSLATDDVELLAISVDSKFTLKAFADQENYEFDLLSDFWPHGEVAKKYGVFVEDRGIASRGTFLIDEQGIVRASIVNGPGEARSLDEYRAALDELNKVGQAN